MPFNNNESGSYPCPVVCLTIIFLFMSIAIFASYLPDRLYDVRQGPNEFTCPFCNMYGIIQEAIRDTQQFLRYWICSNLPQTQEPLRRNVSTDPDKTYQGRKISQEPLKLTEEHPRKSFQELKNTEEPPKDLPKKKSKEKIPRKDLKEEKPSEEKKESFLKLSNLFKKVKNHSTQTSDIKTSKKKGSGFKLFKKKSSRSDCPICNEKLKDCEPECPVAASAIKTKEEAGPKGKALGPCTRCTDDGEPCEAKCPKRK